MAVRYIIDSKISKEDFYEVLGLPVGSMSILINAVTTIKTDLLDAIGRNSSLLNPLIKYEGPKKSDTERVEEMKIVIEKFPNLNPTTIASSISDRSISFKILCTLLCYMIGKSARDKKDFQPHDVASLFRMLTVGGSSNEDQLAIFNFILKHIRHAESFEGIEVALGSEWKLIPIEVDSLLNLQPIELETMTPKNPYKGFESYAIYDGPFYFGREKEIELHLKRLNGLITKQEKRIMFFHGPSGSGKSSFVQAGLLYTLDERLHFYENSDLHNLKGKKHKVLRVQPGARPFENLTRIFWESCSKEEKESLSCTNLSDFEERILDNPMRIKKVLPQHRTLNVLILYIDQLEEIFVLESSRASIRKGEKEIKVFIQILNIVANTPGYQSVLMASYKTGYEDGLEKLNDTLFNNEIILLKCKDYKEIEIGRKDFDLHKVITGPPTQLAQISKHTTQLDPELVEEIVKDFIDDRSLSLLNFTLYRLWSTYSHTKSVITTFDYAELKRTLTCRDYFNDEADKYYNNLEKQPDKQDLIRYIFLNLVRIDGSKLSKQPFNIEDAYKWFDHKGIKEVLDRYSSSSSIPLLSFDDKHAHLLHESIFSLWETYSDWIEEHKVVLSTRQNLRDQWHVWKINSNSSNALPNKQLLDDCKALLPENKYWFNEDDNYFLKATETHYDEQLKISQEKENYERQSAIQKTKDRERKRFTIVLLLIASVFFTFLAIKFIANRQEATISSILVAANNYHAKGDFRRALRFAEIAYKLNPQNIDAQDLIFNSFNDIGAISDSKFLSRGFCSYVEDFNMNITYPDNFIEIDSHRFILLGTNDKGRGVVNILDANTMKETRIMEKGLYMVDVKYNQIKELLIVSWGSYSEKYKNVFPKIPSSKIVVYDLEGNKVYEMAFKKKSLLLDVCPSSFLYKSNNESGSKLNGISIDGRSLYSLEGYGAYDTVKFVIGADSLLVLYGRVGNIIITQTGQTLYHLDSGPFYRSLVYYSEGKLAVGKLTEEANPRNYIIQAFGQWKLYDLKKQQDIINTRGRLVTSKEVFYIHDYTINKHTYFHTPTNRMFSIVDSLPYGQLNFIRKDGNIQIAFLAARGPKTQRPVHIYNWEGTLINTLENTVFNSPYRILSIDGSGSQYGIYSQENELLNIFKSPTEFQSLSFRRIISEHKFLFTGFLHMGYKVGIYNNVVLPVKKFPKGMNYVGVQMFHSYPETDKENSYFLRGLNMDTFGQIAAIDTHSQRIIYKLYTRYNPAKINSVEDTTFYALYDFKTKNLDTINFLSKVNLGIEVNFLNDTTLLIIRDHSFDWSQKAWIASDTLYLYNTRDRNYTKWHISNYADKDGYTFESLHKSDNSSIGIFNAKSGDLLMCDHQDVKQTFHIPNSLTMNTYYYSSKQGILMVIANNKNRKSFLLYYNSEGELLDKFPIGIEYFHPRMVSSDLLNFIDKNLGDKTWQLVKLNSSNRIKKYQFYAEPHSRGIGQGKIIYLDSTFLVSEDYVDETHRHLVWDIDHILTRYCNEIGKLNCNDIKEIKGFSSNKYQRLFKQ